MPSFDFDALRRRPDVEAPDLVAVDATDRLLLDEAAPALETAAPAEVAVVGDHYGAIALGAVALHGARHVRVHQDALSGELALRRNAEAFGLESEVNSGPLGEPLVAGARVVLAQLPRSLDALDEIAAVVSRGAAPDVVLYAGGRVKHMTRGMNDVLGRYFDDVTATRGRQKSRVLVARSPKPDAVPRSWPVRAHDAALDLHVCSFGAAFAGARVDVGTRFLLESVPRMTRSARVALDLGSGTGVIASVLARSRPGLRVIASDQSASAVASTRATAEANGVADRIEVVRDDAASALADGSVDLVVLNPPFHIGNAVHAGIAEKLFVAAGRVLVPGGELWTVWNSGLRYRESLERHVGPTEQVARNATFTVTVSRRH
ncbi:methyltransferase domain-containing protein [Labedella populi]|uniref:Methyltransferase domain-containing protein n=1 Tax=Labedella populi TaxID=2498850 RepID=A0A3S3ZWN0_9MICO|nr:class I SAM-dependent methyltransferase [Labedella populi]RWZ68259.1 methyltransferase domain-containing protein [Labedella populi]